MESPRGHQFISIMTFGMALKPGTRVGPYEVTALVGAGGMGEVYRAHDPRLGRDVAIKVLAAGFSADAEYLRRFEREARAAAALNHPNIVAVYDFGTDNGKPYVVSELLEGETLKDRLMSGPLDIDVVLDTAAQILDALEAAHGRGIVHRDLKPANLFITSKGVAKVLDFGLAKVVGPAGATDAGASSEAATMLALTDLGVAVGTVAYMSPEQARGERVDARSDLFSFGVVLYEMATGRQPFGGATSAVIFDAILNREPASATLVNPRVPPELDRLIVQLLAKDPSSRPRDAQQTRAELRAVGGSQPRESSATRPVPAPSIAVLPFTNLSPGADDAYFADGVTEEIISALGQLKALRVAARTSSFAFKGRTPDVAEVGAKLKVATVLTGSVRRAGRRVRIIVELMNVVDGFQLWSERYDRETDDVFAIQDEIAGAVAQKLSLALHASLEGPFVKRTTVNIEAYELHLKGRYLLNQRADMTRAIEHFQQALALDRDFALSHADIAEAYALLAFYGGLPSHEAMPRARRAAQAALAIDPTLAEAHATLQLVSWMYDWDWEGAEREFEQAMALNPRLVSALQYHVLYLAMVKGAFDEALRYSRRVVDVDPLGSYSHYVVAVTHFCARRFDEAEASCRETLALPPPLWVARRTLGFTLSHQGKHDPAIRALEVLANETGRHQWQLVALTQAFSNAGRKDDALFPHEELMTLSRSTYVQPTIIATSLAAVGRIDDAVEWLQRAYRERDAILCMMNYWPATSFRIDARFAEVLRRTGVPLAPDMRAPDG